MSESGRAFRSDGEELHRARPEPARLEPENDAEAWMAIGASAAALVITAAALLYHFRYLGASLP